MSEKITVAHLLVTLDRIEEWLQVLRKGLEALPQDQKLLIDSGDFPTNPDVRQPQKDASC